MNGFSERLWLLTRWAAFLFVIGWAAFGLFLLMASSAIDEEMASAIDEEMASAIDEEIAESWVVPSYYDQLSTEDLLALQAIEGGDQSISTEDLQALIARIKEVEQQNQPTTPIPYPFKSLLDPPPLPPPFLYTEEEPSAWFSLLIAVGGAVSFWLLQWLITGKTAIAYLLPWKKYY